MVSDNVGQRLHDRATRGESLSSEEQAQLNEWYAEQDRAEAKMLGVTGAFTLRRLRLNRPPLVAHRLRRRREAEVTRLLVRYRDLTEVVERLLTQQATLLEEQQRLLEEQRRLLRLLLGDEE